MKILALALLILAAFAFAPQAATEAASVCGASPSIAGTQAAPFVALSTASQTYITAVCATLSDGRSFTLTQGGALRAVDPAGCYSFYKSPHLAYTSTGAHYTASCPRLTLTIRTVKATA